MQYDRSLEMAGKREMKTLRYSCRPTSVKGGKILMPPLQSPEEQADLQRCWKQPPEAPSMNDHAYQHPEVIQLHQPFSRNTEVPCLFRRITFLDHSSTASWCQGHKSCLLFPLPYLAGVLVATHLFLFCSLSQLQKHSKTHWEWTQIAAGLGNSCEWRILQEQTSCLVHSLLSQWQHMALK